MEGESHRSHLRSSAAKQHSSSCLLLHRVSPSESVPGLQREHLIELQRSDNYEGHEFLSSQRLSNFVFNFEDAVRRAMAEAADIRLTAAEQQRAHQHRQAHDRKFSDELQSQLHIEAQKALALEAQVQELLAARDEAHLLQARAIVLPTLRYGGETLVHRSN